MLPFRCRKNKHRSSQPLPPSLVTTREDDAPHNRSISHPITIRRAASRDADWEDLYLDYDDVDNDDAEYLGDDDGFVAPKPRFPPRSSSLPSARLQSSQESSPLGTSSSQANSSQASSSQASSSQGSSSQAHQVADLLILDRASSLQQVKSQVKSVRFATANAEIPGEKDHAKISEIEKFEERLLDSAPPTKQQESVSPANCCEPSADIGRTPWGLVQNTPNNGQARQIQVIKRKPCRSIPATNCAQPSVSIGQDPRNSFVKTTSDDEQTQHLLTVRQKLCRNLPPVNTTQPSIYLGRDPLSSIQTPSSEVQTQQSPAIKHRERKSLPFAQSSAGINQKSRYSSVTFTSDQEQGQSNPAPQTHPSSSSKLVTPKSTAKELPPQLKVRMWTPPGSKGKKLFQSIEAGPSGIDPSPNQLQLTCIYMCHRHIDDLIQIYRDWPVDKLLPMQFSNIWGDNIVNGNRVENPTFQSSKGNSRFDLYGWTSPSGLKVYGYVDFNILTRFLLSPTHSALREEQALQFENIHTLVVDYRVLRELAKYHHNLDFLRQLPRLRRLIVNIEDSHFGPSPGFEEMMGFQPLSRNSEHAIFVQRHTLHLLSAVANKYPYWLMPSIIPVIPDRRAVAQFRSQPLHDFDSDEDQIINLRSSMERSVSQLPTGRYGHTIRNIPISHMEPEIYDGQLRARKIHESQQHQDTIHADSTQQTSSERRIDSDPSNIPMPESPDDIGSNTRWGLESRLHRSVTNTSLVNQNPNQETSHRSSGYNQGDKNIPGNRLSNTFGGIKLPRSLTSTSLWAATVGKQHEGGIEMLGKRLSHRLNAIPEKLKSTFASSFKAYGVDENIACDSRSKDL